MQEVVKKEIINWLHVEVIYPISDNNQVSPVQCVPKKGGMTVVANDKNELVLLGPVTRWRVCIDYKKLNKQTLKDHFPMPYMDQMVDKLEGRGCYYFLDGYSAYNQISITPEDQEKTIFTNPYRTFAFSQMSFSIYNAPATFQLCMMSIFLTWSRTPLRYLQITFLQWVILLMIFCLILAGPYNILMKKTCS